MSNQTETKNLIDELTVSDDFNIGLTGEQIFSQHHISAKKPTETEWFRVYGSNIDELKKGVLCKVKVGFKDEDFIIGGDNKFASSLPSSSCLPLDVKWTGQNVNVPGFNKIK